MSSDLKPWEEGYVAPVITPLTHAEIGALGGQKSAARRKAGLPPLPVSDKTGKPGRKRTNPERQEKFDKMTAENLAPARKMFLDIFVKEYIHDFNAAMAFIRAGGNVGRANTAGGECLRTAYVQNQLKMLSEYLDEEKLVTRGEIVMGIKKEANYHGEDSSSASRVKAWGTLAKIKGMEAPKKIDIVDERPKGGVMEVPMVATEVEWQDMASASQQQLKNDVRT